MISRFPLEDFPHMPLDKVGFRVEVGMLRRSQGLSVECGQPFIESMGAVSPVRNLNLQFRGNCESASVKEFVMKGAQGYPILFRIRPAGLVPFDVGGFQGDEGVSHPHIESTYRTLMLIRLNNPVTEIRISSSFVICLDQIQIEADGLKDVFMDGGGEIGFQYFCSDFSGCFRI